MYNLDTTPRPLQARERGTPHESPGDTFARKDAPRAQPKQAEIHPDHQQASAQTVKDLFALIETWDEKETKRVGRSFRRQIEKVIRLAKDRLFEQECKKRVEKMAASEEIFAKNIAQTRSRSHLSHVAGHIPLWRAHHLALAMEFEVVNDTFGTLMQQDPYYQISTVRKARLFIPLFASELHQRDKQDILFWMKQGGAIVYRNTCETNP